MHTRFVAWYYVEGKRQEKMCRFLNNVMLPGVRIYHVSEILQSLQSTTGECSSGKLKRLVEEAYSGALLKHTSKHIKGGTSGPLPKKVFYIKSMDAYAISLSNRKVFLSICLSTGLIWIETHSCDMAKTYAMNAGINTNQVRTLRKPFSQPYAQRDMSDILLRRLQASYEAIPKK